jgi:haloalkane dehalogenase
MPISDAPMPTKCVTVEGLRMAYAEMGEGPTILFQHGNPTSGYLWRNILPQLADLGRCIAVDLIGMGHSDKLPDSGHMRYDFATHSRMLDGAFDALGVGDDVVLVLHDWGSALGFDWARRHAQRVQGIAYMESIVRPIPAWEAFPENARNIFQALRSPAGESLILDKNLFVERILPASILRDLTEVEMTQYRAPFADAGEARRPTLDWPRQIPIAGEPPEILARVQAYADWLSTSEVPKLFVNAEPGSILTGELRDFCRTWPNQTEITVAGSHFIQEDSPDEIAAGLRLFVQGLRPVGE